MQSTPPDTDAPDLGHEDFVAADAPDRDDVDGLSDGQAGEADAGRVDADDSDAAERLREEHAELKDKYLRLMAEFDNFRKRTARQRNEERATAAVGTMNSLLPVLDDFDRAAANAETTGAKEIFDQGVGLVHEKLKRVLGNLGLKRMSSTGEPFDADKHEAFTEIPAPSAELVGKVVDTIEPGYTLNDKIIRHAKVVVGK